MKKVLIGVGIGCGVLSLVAIIGVVAAGYWAKGKIEETAGGFEAFEQQSKRIEDLNSKYAFTAPPKGRPLKLEEGRLEDYFEIRRSLKPVLAKYQQESKKFEGKNGNEASLSDGIAAMGMVGSMMKELQVAWAEGLDKHKMSPNEFHAITGALYGSQVGTAMAGMNDMQRQVLTESKAQLEKQVNDPNLGASMREAAKQQIQQIDEQLAAIPEGTQVDEELKQLYAENTKLAEKYKAELEDDDTRGLDILLPGAAEGLGEAFKGYGQTDDGSEPSDP